MSVNGDSNNRASREQIERRAYELYLERGEVQGYELEDWLRAEDELLGRQEGHRQHENARIGSDDSSYGNRLHNDNTRATLDRSAEEARTSKPLGKVATHS